jgi:hypothetical protein
VRKKDVKTIQDALLYLKTGECKREFYVPEVKDAQ